MASFEPPKRNRRQLAARTNLDPRHRRWRDIANELSRQLDARTQQVDNLLADPIPDELLKANAELGEALARIAVAAGLDPGTPADRVERVVTHWRKLIEALSDERLDGRDFALVSLLWLAIGGVIGYTTTVAGWWS